jgi:hypothetical protein
VRSFELLYMGKSLLLNKGGVKAGLAKRVYVVLGGGREVEAPDPTRSRRGAATCSW